MRTVRIHRVRIAWVVVAMLVAAVGAGFYFESAANAAVKTGRWSGTAFSEDGDYASVSFRVERRRVRAFKSRGTVVPCGSLFGISYEPLTGTFTVPSLRRNTSRFWGQYLEYPGDDDGVMRVLGTWKRSSRASGVFTLDYFNCHAKYQFRAHWRP